MLLSFILAIFLLSLTVVIIRIIFDTWLFETKACILTFVADIGLIYLVRGIIRLRRIMRLFKIITETHKKLVR